MSELTVTINGEVRRVRLGETMVADGDSIELVHFVGGG